MAEQGPRSAAVKKYSRHASHGSIPDDKVNILKRDSGTETISQKRCTDITCIHVQKEGWTYPASVMDLCSRKITGYAYGTSMTAEPAVKAAENACLNVRDTKGIILHSDPGSRYTGKAFEECLSGKEISRPQQHRHLKRKDSIRFLVFPAFSSIQTGRKIFSASAITVCAISLGLRNGFSQLPAIQLRKVFIKTLHLKDPFTLCHK